MADLFDETNTKVGTHFVGPTWMSSVDGSDVVGMKVDGAASPMSDAIDWLKLKAVSHMGAGIFADVNWILRLNTTKGKAPATGCDAAHVDTDTSVDYTADYYFYKSSVTTDGGAVADWPFTAVVIPGGIALNGPTLKFKAHAIGDQIYTCTGTTSSAGDGGADAGVTTYAWALKQPDAKLYDDTNTQIGTHGLGPNWTSTKDASVVTAAKVAGVASTLSDAIDWLELKANGHTGAGVFSDVTYVQRVNTTKGKAPATGCDAAHAAAEVKVGYTADYYFYTGDVVTADAGTD
jgi:hypothetical protein